MDEPMTKTRLIETLKARRAAWEAALGAVPEARRCERGAAGAWSVKDLIVQLVYQEQWYADRLDEARRGEVHWPCELDRLPAEERDQIIQRQNHYRPLTDVLAEAHFSFRRLVRAVEAHSEAFLARPQAFAGRPEPRPVWEALHGEVVGQYDLQGASLRAWLAGERV